MSVRLREAEAQAELRETRQRLLEVETQVSFSLFHFLCSFSFFVTLCLSHSFTLSHTFAFLLSLLVVFFCFVLIPQSRQAVFIVIPYITERCNVKEGNKVPFYI